MNAEQKTEFESVETSIKQHGIVGNVAEALAGVQIRSRGEDVGNAGDIWRAASQGMAAPEAWSALRKTLDLLFEL